MKHMNTLRFLDYGLAIGSLAYGLYAQSLLFLAGGSIGLVLAWVNPAKRIRNLLFTRIRRRNEPAIKPAAAFPLPPSTPYERRPSVKGQ